MKGTASRWSSIASANAYAPALAPVTRQFLFGSALLWLSSHLLVWTVTATTHHLDWAAMLDTWDSSWYTRIIREGYFTPAWAFYPLYPLVVGGLSKALALASHPQVTGTILSTLLFAVYCHLTAKLAARPDERLSGLTPTTRAGWLLFLFSPASFVFHSHHTESLFLLLSLVGFMLALRPENGRWLLAAVVGGLGALTRPQGILLAVALAIASCASVRDWPRRGLRFAASGAVSGALFACYPLYQWWTAGDPWLSQSSQLAWRPEMTALSFVRTFWLGNAWQNTNIGSIERHIGFFALIAATSLLWRHHRVLAVYVGMCVGVMPAAGEFVGLFRYGSVLFPALFVAGERVGRLPRLLLLAVSCYLLYLNFSLTRRYVLFRWCY
jgi:hypothetical protein